MKAYIYFLRDCERGWTCRETTTERAADDIRYWLGKSPGMHDLEDIIVLPESEKKDWLQIQRDMQAEQAKREAAMLDAQERAEYERLKKKYGPA